MKYPRWWVTANVIGFAKGLLVCLILHHLISVVGEASQITGDDQAIANFQRWCQAYQTVPDAASRLRLLDEGLACAGQRRAVMQRLIRENPRHALELAASFAMRQQLPPQVTALLEERISGVGDLHVVRNATTTAVISVDGLVREVRINGHTYAACVYGQRLVDQDFTGVSFHGIIIDGVMAVAESPLRVLETNEIPAAQFHSGKIHIQLGTTIQSFDTQAEVDQFELKLRYPRGVPPLTPEEEARRAKLPSIRRVHLNPLGLQRLNARRQAKGLAPLTADDVKVAPSGQELELEGSVAVSHALPSPPPLPGGVDNSSLIAFPPIRNQSAQNSCACFNTTYYMMTHMTALARGWNAKTGGDNYHFSPKWTYNMVNNGGDNGSFDSDALNIGRDHGLATWTEFPYSGSTTDVLAWCLNSNVWCNAVSRRMSGYYVLNNVNTAAGLANLKTLLDNGYVVTFDCYTPWPYRGWVQGRVGKDPSTTTDTPYTNQLICTYVKALDWGHTLTIVGYDDDIWCDLNGNGVVDPGEKGALKMANSWGTWANGGYVWFSYDALRSTTAVPGWIPPGKISGISGNCVYVTTAQPNYSPTMLAWFTINAPQRYAIAMKVGKDSTGVTSNPGTTWAPSGLNFDGGAYAFDGSTNACNGTFYLDLTGLNPDPQLLKRYFIGMQDIPLPGAGAQFLACGLVDLSSGQQIIVTPTNIPNSFNPSNGAVTGTTGWGWIDHSYQVCADIALTASASAAPLAFGQNLTYTITVTNLGPSATTDVTVTNTFPTTATFVSLTPSQGTWTNFANTVVWDLGPFNSNATAQAALVVTPTATGLITNTASVASPVSDSNLANNTVTLITSVTQNDNWLPTNGKWETAANWSLGSAPTNTDSIFLTNTVAGTITIDATTATNFTSTLTINNLILASPNASTNTLYLFSAGTNTPLRVLDSLVLGSGGAILITNSVLRVDGLAGGACNIDGFVALQPGGMLVLTNLSTCIGNLANGQFIMNGGTLLARDVTVALTSASQGQWLQSGGSAMLTSNLMIAAAANSTGTVALTGGQLTVTNATTIIASNGVAQFTTTNATVLLRDLVLASESSSSGTLTVSGGTMTLSSPIVNVANFIIGRDAGATGSVWFTGGYFLATNAPTIFGSNGVATVTSSSGTVGLNSLTLACETGATGSWSILGGTNYLTGPLCAGAASNSTGTVLLNGGQLDITNATTQLGNFGSGQLTVSNGTWLAQGVYIGYAAGGTGTLTIAGGASQISADLTLGDYPAASGTFLLTGGQLIATNGVTTLGFFGTGQAILSNGTFLANGCNLGVNAGSVGTLTVAGGTMTLSSIFTLGNLPGATGVVWLTTGQLITTNAITYIGDAGNGSLTVSSGAWLAANVTVGAQSNSTGALTFAGGAAQINNTLTVRSGVLIVSNGAVTVTTLILTNGSAAQFNFPAGTLNLYTAAISNGTPCTVGNGINSAIYNLTGGLHTFGNGLLLQANSFLTGCGAIVGTVTNKGTIYLTCSTVFSNAVVNLASLVVSNGAVVDFYQPVVNNGVINAVFGAVNFHAGVSGSGFYLNADGDPYGTGMSNLQRALAGMDLLDPASYFHITSVAVEGEDMLVTWMAGGGRTNVVQASSSLSGSFTNISPPLFVLGTGTVITNYLDTGGATNWPARFYRINLVQ